MAGNIFNQNHTGSGNNVINVGTREQNALYQDDRKVAIVVNGAFTDKEGEILFGEIRFIDSADTTRPFQFQGVRLICDTPSVISTAPGNFMNLVDNVRCRILK